MCHFFFYFIFFSQIFYLLNSSVPRGAVWSGSTLFSIPSASSMEKPCWSKFRMIRIFWVSEFLGVLRYMDNSLMHCIGIELLIMMSILKHKKFNVSLFLLFYLFLSNLPNSIVPRGAVWSGSTLFAIPSASSKEKPCWSKFRMIRIFWVSEFLGVLRYMDNSLMHCIGIELLIMMSILKHKKFNVSLFLLFYLFLSNFLFTK